MHPIRRISSALVLVAALLVLWVSAAAGQPAYSDFDDGTLQGWTKVAPFNGRLLNPNDGLGNPGGYLLTQDTMAGGGGLWAAAPSAFLGDLSGYSGLYWDEYLYGCTPNPLRPTRVVLVGTDGTKYSEIYPAVGPEQVWRLRFASFDAGSWSLASGSASFATVLQNVAELRLDMDVNTQCENEARVDNVALDAPLFVTVPWVEGFDQATAEAQIVAAGLAVGTVTDLPDPLVPVGEVMSQNPAGGTRARSGSSVDLVVSAGVAVPDVVGLAQATAEADIVSEGLLVGVVTTSTHESVPAGDVISQNPLAGTRVDGGTAVDLVVSLGPPVCHDGIWSEGEFCGRDAFLVTGSPEMNHDCRVDLLDVLLVILELGTGGGPGFSGDIDGNWMVTMADLTTVVASIGQDVTPCNNASLLIDRCEGSIALSFSSDPATIVSTRSQVPGPGRAYIAVDGWTDPFVLDYGIESSSNVVLTDHAENGIPYDLAGGLMICSPDSHHTELGAIKNSSGSWTPPIAFSYVDYDLLDSNPAWIRLVPESGAPSCPGSSRVRWAKLAADRSFDFASVSNVGINGPAPGGESTCQAWQLPVLDVWLLWLLAALLAAAGIVALSRLRWSPR